VVYDNDSYIHWFPQGLAYVAAVLRDAGHEVVIYNQDLHHYPESHLTDYLDREHFDVVGLSTIAGYYQYRKLLAISDAINASSDRPVYVIGGHGPSPDPAYFMSKTGADAIVIGEGEHTVLELLEAFAGSRPLSTVDGIAYDDGGTCVVNRRRGLVRDIDTLPLPAYDLFPMEYYRLLRMPHSTHSDFIMPMLSGRGCTFACTFCYRMDKGFRSRSNEAIIEEMRYLKESYGITYIAFSDELLMSSVKRTASFCEALIKADLGMKWDCNGRLNYATPELLRLMKRAGCVFINYGIEAMDDDVLRDMKKHLDTEQIVTGIEATLAEGISPGFNIIFGNIGDSAATMRKAVDFLLKYDDGAQMRTIRPVTPYPGTELFQTAVERGLVADTADFYENKHTNSDLLSMNMTEMSDAELYDCLTWGNIELMNAYYTKQQASMEQQVLHLYGDRDASFRGFRQS
jgi:radical SAM superfamily enzyme YgiQ (UPF0313 family)